LRGKLSPKESLPAISLLEARAFTPPKGFSMDPVTSVYVASMAMGFLWIIWRIVIYVRSQKQREFLWDKLTYDESFMNFLEGVKSREASKSRAEAPEETETVTEARAELSKLEGESDKG
jgi:hypothetical protein